MFHGRHQSPLVGALSTFAAKFAVIHKRVRATGLMDFGRQRKLPRESSAIGLRQVATFFSNVVRENKETFAHRLLSKTQQHVAASRAADQCLSLVLAA